MNMSSRVGGVEIVANELVPQGLMSLWRQGCPVTSGPIGSPIAGVDFDKIILNPVDYEFLQKAFGGACCACGEKTEVMEAEPGEHVQAFADRVVARSRETGCNVLGSHNQHLLECSPGMSREQVLAPWHEAQCQSYTE